MPLQLPIVDVTQKSPFNYLSSMLRKCVPSTTYLPTYRCTQVSLQFITVLLLAVEELLLRHVNQLMINYHIYKCAPNCSLFFAINLLQNQLLEEILPLSTALNQITYCLFEEVSIYMRFFY